MGTSMVYLGSTALLYGYLLLSRTFEVGTTIFNGAILTASALLLFSLLIWTALFLVVLFLSNHSTMAAVAGWILTIFFLVEELGNFPFRVQLLFGRSFGVSIPVPVITHLLDRIILLGVALAIYLAVPNPFFPNSQQPRLPLLQKLKGK